MFDIQQQGRTIRVRPVGGVLHSDSDGAIILERATALRLVTELDSALQIRNTSEDTEGEDG